MKIDISTWLFLMVVGLGWWAATLYDSNVSVKKDNDNLKQDNVRQSEVIAKQSLQFNSFNLIATSAHRNGIQADAKAQEKVIEYKTILQKEFYCDDLVPQPVADGLFEYTKELRSRAMRANSSNAN
ncbi:MULTISPECIES: hypothetical protein [Providencia]|uniref:DUF2570 domain-containing protein n=2 Tax=Providencia TaxID=586 RepID=A0AA42JXN1_9GAMM|nr:MULTISPECIES: hypothetical protein [Providencia]MDG4695661.1 hypothetical protein [Providencia sp. CRE-3FA-0001]MDT0133107.1 hypothetical protein [Providencia huaxiensis]MDT1979513.1 hypothetical protein [Providencia huaxiensis]